MPLPAAVRLNSGRATQQPTWCDPNRSHRPLTPALSRGGERENDIVSDHSDIAQSRRGVARRAPLDESREIRIGAHGRRWSVADLTLSERRGTTSIVVRAPFTGLVAVAVLGPALHAGFGGRRGTSAGPFTGLLAVRLESIGGESARLKPNREAP